MDVEGPDGAGVNWAVEMGNPTALLRRGLRKSDFPPGIEFVVEGYLAKDGTPTANGITVTFPDGRNFSPARPARAGRSRRRGNSRAMAAVTARSGAAASLCLAALAAACGQPPAGEPAAYVAPRTAEGQPDLQGVWQALNTAAWDIQDHSASAGVPAGQGVGGRQRDPLSAVGAATEAGELREPPRGRPRDPLLHAGRARITYMPYPFQILQFSDRILILYEYIHVTRTIYMDGSPHPEGHIDFWMGDSRGRWGGRHAGGGRDPLQRPDLVRPRRGTSTAQRCTSWSAIRRPVRTICTTRPPSRTPRCSRGPGP